MTDKLSTDLRISRPDDFYEALIEAHRDLSDEESRHLNARLILILANQVGDMAILADALELARTVGDGRVKSLNQTPKTRAAAGRAPIRST
jgi:hypothetical protein